MKTLLTLLLISQLTLAQDNSTTVSGLVAEVKQLKKELSEYKESQRCFKSNWISVNKNQISNAINHNLGVQPSKAFIWLSANDNGDNAMLMDSIFSNNSGGYGTWLINVNISTFKYTTGPMSSSSVYGKINDRILIDGEQNQLNFRERYIKIVLCK